MPHATLDDIEAILDLAEEARDKSDTHAALPTDRDIACKSLNAMLANPYCFVGFTGNGVLIAIAGRSWCRDGYDIADLFFYARKNGRALIREYVDWAKGFPGVNQTLLGTTFGGEAGDRTDEFYSKIGMERIGSMHRVKTL